MYRKQVAFQLENTVPGTFLMQGLLGGVLGGFVATLVAEVAWNPNDFRSIIDFALFAILISGISGIIKAAFIWGVYRLSGVQLSAATRIAVAFVGTALLVGLLFYIGFERKFLVGCSIWLITAGIPVALLVGSRIKPWQVFTFGNIAAGDVDQRSGSKSIPATLGTLPLRFLSLSVLALLLMYDIPEFKRLHLIGEVFGVVLGSIILAVYPAYSAYVSFRSPRKLTLLVVGILINTPVALIAILLYQIPPDSFWMSGNVQSAKALSSLFVVAWLIFLVARLSAKLSPAPYLSIRSNKSIAAAPHVGHECLGSRFAEWQQHAA